MSSSTKDQFTICFPSLDRGYLKSRLFSVLDELSEDKNLFDCNILVLAQQFTSESTEIINSLKTKLPNLTVIHKDGLIKSFPMIRTEPAKLASTEFVYVTDDDTHFNGDSSEFLASIKTGIEILERSKLIKMINLRRVEGTNSVYLKFPHRITDVRNLYRRSDVFTSLFNQWLNVRNLEDICLSPCLLDENYLTAIIGLDKFKHHRRNTEEGDSFTASTHAFGVPITKRMTEYYIVMANFDDKVRNYRRLIDELVNSESNLVKDLSINIDRDGTETIHKGSWTPRASIIDEYLSMTDKTNWKLRMLESFYVKLGLSGLPNPDILER